VLIRKTIEFKEGVLSFSHDFCTACFKVKCAVCSRDQLVIQCYQSG